MARRCGRRGRERPRGLARARRQARGARNSGIAVAAASFPPPAAAAADDESGKRGPLAAKQSSRKWARERRDASAESGTLRAPRRRRRRARGRGSCRRRRRRRQPAPCHSHSAPPGSASSPSGTGNVLRSTLREPRRKAAVWSRQGAPQARQSGGAGGAASSPPPPPPPPSPAAAGAGDDGAGGESDQSASSAPPASDPASRTGLPSRGAPRRRSSPS